MTPWHQAKYAVKGVWALVLGLVVLTSVAVAVVMSVQLNGFRLWPFKIEGAYVKIERLEGELQAVLLGQKMARQAQIDVNDAKEKAYSDIAENINDTFDIALGRNLSATEQFIRNQRLRCPTSGSQPRQADPTPEGQGAGVLTSVPTDTFVAVADRDVQACSAAVTYALRAHEWGVKVNAENGDTRADTE